jgi:hypothetical protein
MDLTQHHDGVQGPMQLPIPTPVEAMTDDLARGRLDRGRPTELSTPPFTESRARPYPPDHHQPDKGTPC